VALAHLERNRAAMRADIDRQAARVVSGAARGPSRTEVLPGVGRGAKASREAAVRLLEKRREAIQALANDPEKLLASSAELADQLAEHAPETAQELATAHTRAVSYLASKLPQRPSAGPLAAKWEVSKAEASEFARHYEAVEDPASILRQAAAGTLTAEAVEAVRTVYPALYAQMQESIAERLASRRSPLPYASRMMLGILSGSDLDGSLAGMPANQQALEAPTTKPSEAPRLRGDPEAVTLASRSALPSQRGTA
jgi:hypothetical protein